MIGIDVSKQTLAVCRLEKGEEEPTWERSYPNSEAGLRQLLADSPPEQPWVMEPTGGYSELGVRLGQEAGRQVLMAQTQAARHFLQSLNPRAKNDKVDARGLARYGNATRLRVYRLKEPALQRLWELLQVRCGLTRAAASLRQQSQAFPAAACYVQGAIADLKARVKALDQELQEAAQELELFGRLLEIPGVGRVTATALIVRLLGMEFLTDDAFVAYAGLDLRVCDTGQRRGRRRLTKRGDAQLRWLLYLAAQANLVKKGDTGFKELYQRKCAEGWSTTAALCIVARKLAKVAWSLAHSGQRYDPARVFSAPSRGPLRAEGS